MNRKLLVRIVINNYICFGKTTALTNEITMLRNYKNSKNKIIDALMDFHERIIKNDGHINFDAIIEFIRKYYHINLKNENKYIDLLRSYMREQIDKIIELVYDLNIEKMYKVPIMELLVNTLYYKNYQEMLLFKSPLLKEIELKYNSNYDYLKYLKTLTDYFLKERKLLSQKEIKEIANSIKEFEYADALNVYVFGSYAKHQEDKYSDLDLFVEIKSSEIPLDVLETTLIRMIDSKFDVDVDLVVHLYGTKYDEFDQDILKYAVEVE